MKFQFDEHDFKQLEDAVYRGMLRAFKEATRQALTPVFTEMAARVDHEFVVAEAHPATGARHSVTVMARSVEEAISTARKQRGWMGRILQVAEVAKEEAPPVAPPAAIPAAPPLPAGLTPVTTARKAEKKKRIDLKALLKRVGPRPEGYISRPDALKLVGGDQAAQTFLSNCITQQQIPAVIVCERVKPAKGLPGQIFVLKEALLRRNEERQRNRVRHPMLRRHLAAEPTLATG